MIEPWQPGPVLGIETSCDETAVAVFDPRRRADGDTGVLSDVLSSQVALHAPHGGVVPEVASRAHLAALPSLFDEALQRSGLGLDELAGLAVTCGPGLVGALLVGVSHAKSLALATGLPLVGVHHLDGHVRAAFLEHEEPEDDYLALVVSGGHSSLFRVERGGPGVRHHRCLAKTLDDAVGEAYDKVGKMMGLRYPSGPIIDRAVAGHDGPFVPFPKARIKAGRRGMDKGRLDHRAFSFSGVKTSVRQHLRQHEIAPLQSDESLKDRPDLLAILAGFQETAVAMLVEPTVKILREEGLHDLVVVGGVSANSRLRARFREEERRRGFRLLLPSPRWSTDNAAMIAAAGALALESGRRDGLELAADPALVLGVAS
ncbi:MAG: tRNA (adenosine(37)-N6)-threonylcarbamoyltransferase complex transferase subunit TsaD [Acidobacteriota bacterium]